MNEQEKFTIKAPRRNLKQIQKLLYNGDYVLPERLFKKRTSLLDFEFKDYSRFLDDIMTLPDLIAGLSALSPFADDALDIAERMTDQDFATFKLTLAQERSIAKKEESDSVMPDKFSSLVLPAKFIMATAIADKAATSLVVTMARILETKAEPK